MQQRLRTLLVALEGDAARPDDADPQPPLGNRELRRELGHSVARRHEHRRCGDRCKVLGEQARQAAEVAMVMRVRQRLVARHEIIDDAEGRDERDQLGLALHHQFAAERLDAGEIARHPQRIAEPLLHHQHQAFAGIRLTRPRLAGQPLLRQLPGKAADLVIRPGLAIITEIEIAARAIPAHHLTSGIELERARERGHRLAVLASLGKRRAEILVEQRLPAIRQGKRLPVAGDGALQMPQLRQRIAEIGPYPGVVRRTGDGIAITPQRIEMAPHRREHHPAGIAQIRVVGVVGDSVAQHRLGLGEFAGAV